MTGGPAHRAVAPFLAKRKIPTSFFYSSWLDKSRGAQSESLLGKAGKTSRYGVCTSNLAPFHWRFAKGNIKYNRDGFLYEPRNKKSAGGNITCPTTL
jgi:hypothetical protein